MVRPDFLSQLVLGLESVGKVTGESTSHVLDEGGTRFTRLDAEIAVGDAARANGNIGSGQKANNQTELPQNQKATLIRIEVASRCNRARDAGRVSSVAVEVSAA
jgi:hypothetical protein